MEVDSVYIIGDFRGLPDEAMKKISFKFRDFLKQKGFDVYSGGIGFGLILKLIFGKINRIYSLSGPSEKKLSFLIFIAKYFSNIEIIVFCSNVTQFKIKWDEIKKPQNVRILSWDKNLTRLNPDFIYVEEWPCDVDRFYPRSSVNKNIRQTLGVSLNDRLYLHVGHANEGRNIRELTRNIPNKTKLLVIVSTTVKNNPVLVEDLKNNDRVILINKYLPNIEEYYSACDAYFFPVRDPKWCIDLPLSIVEAASIGLPVKTTRFGILNEDYSGLHYVDGENDWYNEFLPNTNSSQHFKIVHWQEFFQKIL